MAGIYDTAAPLMDEARTNAHWKREQDNYLSQIGAMDLIKKDPMASLGYKIRSANPNRTLEMGGEPGGDFYGLYQYAPGKSGGLDYTGPRFDGTLDVAVGLNPNHYGQVLSHELGHVGSRNSQSDGSLDAPHEELRQRLVDYVNNAPGSQMHRDAMWFLTTQYGMSLSEIDDAANSVRMQLGIKPKPKAASKEPAPAKKKAKRKVPAGTNPLKDD